MNPGGSQLLSRIESEPGGAGRPGHRVVVLSGSSFNRVRGGGLMLSNLFAGWPHDRLAMIHCDAIPPSNDVCDDYYELTGKEITRLGPFLGMRSPFRQPVSTWSGNASGAAQRPTRKAARKPARSAARVAALGKRMLFGNMLPDRGHLSPELIAWLDGVRPTVLYTILGSNSMMDLALAIRDRFATRLVVHFLDDWPSVAYRGGALSFAPRRRMRRRLRDIISRADLRFGISLAMCQEYEARYHRTFEPFMNAVDTSHYATLRSTSTQARGSREILYIGSILRDVQLQSLIDSCRAAALLRDRGVTLTILTSAAHLALFRFALELAPNITVGEAPLDDDEYIRRLQAASVLLLPVNFDGASVAYIRYSLPTKVPAYLASGTPILAYGPRGTAQIEYAGSERWAHVVSERDVARLSEAMDDLIASHMLREELTKRAMSVARSHHDIGETRGRFQSAIAKIT